MLGEMVRAYRLRRGMSQEDLAGVAGVSVRSIRKIETGRTDVPRPATLRLLADALKLTGDERDRLLRTAAGTPTRPDAGVPRQLPADVYGFTGRIAQLSELDAMLPSTGSRSPAVVICALDGTAGVGKTALVVHWAHRVADRFPDGQLYVNLRGFDPGGLAMTPSAAIRGFLDALDVAPERIPATLDGQVGLYRSLVAGRRLLVILDNARDAEQVRPLLPGSPGCFVVVTSRNRLSGLVAAEGAQSLTLDLMSTVECRDLLAGRLGRDRVAAEPDAVDEIIACCARLPLALSIVAARGAIRPGVPLAVAAAELRAAGGLDVFADTDPAIDVRSVFSWSYRTLTAGAAQLLRLLGLHPGPDAGLPAVASLAGLPAQRVRLLLNELTRAHLLAEHTPGRFSFHDLLRAYAAETAEAVDPEPDRRAATHRMLDHYLHSARAADVLLFPLPLDLPPCQPGVSPEQPADERSALAWFAAEHLTLMASVRRAAGLGFDTHTWMLAQTLGEFLSRRGYWPDMSAAHTVGRTAAQRSSDRLGLAHANAGIARAHGKLGRYPDAERHYRRALELFSESGHPASQARVHRGLGWALQMQSRHREALWHAEQALGLYRAVGDERVQADALNAVGCHHAYLGNYEQALIHCEQALAMAESGFDKAATLDSLGYIHHRLGNHEQAVDLYRQALDMHTNLGDRFYGAEVLTHLGDVHCAAGEPGEAARAWSQAVTIFDELGHPEADQVRDKLRELAVATDAS